METDRDQNTKTNYTPYRVLLMDILMGTFGLVNEMETGS